MNKNPKIGRVAYDDRSGLRHEIARVTVHGVYAMKNGSLFFVPWRNVQYRKKETYSEDTRMMAAASGLPCAEVAEITGEVNK